MTTILAFDVPPNSTDFNGGPAVFGNDFTANAPGTITGVWYYHEASNEPTSVTVTVHRQANQQLMSSKARPTGGLTPLTDDAYNLITLDNPVSYPTPGEVMTVSTYWPLGGFSFSLGVGARTSDGLTINVGSIGRFKNSGVTEGDFPTQSLANLACPVGVEFVFAGTPAPTIGSWEQLLSIERERAELLRLSRATPPLACPNDGEPLQPGAVSGTLHCPFDGWQWPRDGEEIR